MMSVPETADYHHMIDDPFQDCTDILIDLEDLADHDSRTPEEEEEAVPAFSPYPRTRRSASMAFGAHSLGSNDQSPLSLILEMDKAAAQEHSQTLHDDIEKLFDKAPRFSLRDLSSGQPLPLVSERSDIEEEAPVLMDRYFDERDFKSHRRASFPHTHMPLRTLQHHSSKNLAALEKIEEKKKRKIKRKEKKNRLKESREAQKRAMIFPSKSSLMSPVIPEVDMEHQGYSSWDEDVSEDDDEASMLLDGRLVDVSKPITIPSRPKTLAGIGVLPLPVLHFNRPPVTFTIDEVDSQTSLTNGVVQVQTPPTITSSLSESLDAVTHRGGKTPRINGISQSEAGVVVKQQRTNQPQSPARVKHGQSESGVPVVQSESLVTVAVNQSDNDVGVSQSTPIPIFNIGQSDAEITQMDGTCSHVSKSPESAFKPGLFYIGSDPHHDMSPQTDFHSPAHFPSSPEHSHGSGLPFVYILNTDDSKPVISTSVQQSMEDHVVAMSEDDSMPVISESSRFATGDYRKGEEKLNVQFLLGGESDLSQQIWQAHKEAAEKPDHRPLEGESSVSPRSSRHRKHRRHHHHERDRYNMEDLLGRRQRGSDVQLCDTTSQVPTETDEALMLKNVDLDEMASHRMEDHQGIRRHKIARKNHGTLSSFVHIGKPDKSGKRTYFKPSKKTFDHSPHEVFVELDELYVGSVRQDIEWREKARWIKFEEDVEEGANRWGKPHVASLSFHSLIELRKGLEQGSLLLDLEARDLSSIIHRVVDNMVIRDQIRAEHRGLVMRTLMMKHKHQRDQQSLMKSLSSASFASIPSSGNLQQHQSNNNTYDQNIIDHSGNNAPLSVAYKHNGTQGSPGELEFVKVDVDNNMAMQDGVHIGIAPKRTASETRDAKNAHILRRIPCDAEACTVLVGCVDYLDKPAMAFVRLAEHQILENLTEVPLPVRFVFILLGPSSTSMDYHEVGRSISTLMSNQHFHEIAYKAETRSEILHAINEFLNESIVLPPGDWDQKTLLPVMDMARKRAKVRRRKQKKKKEMDALLFKEKMEKIPMDPLKRTGKLFGGLVNDIKRRYPHYASDIYDAFNLQCLMALIFIFIACLAPCIAFGGLLEEKTQGKMGVTETVFSTAVTNIVFGLFSAQPLLLYGPNGPVLVFEKHLYAFCKTSHIEFLTWRVWIGLWVFVITVLVIAVEGSFLVRYITRFTEEVFAILISLIFIFEVIHKLQEIFRDHPLGPKSFYCDTSNTSAIDGGNTSHMLNISVINATQMPYHTTLNVLNLTAAHIKRSVINLTEGDNEGHVISVVTGNTMPSTKLMYSTKHGHAVEEYDGHGANDEKYNKPMLEPNTALLSTILIFGTFLIAYFLRIFRNSKFLGRSARRALGDFGIFTAIVVMVLFDYICADTYTQKLDIPDLFEHTDHTTRQWIVNPLGYDQDMEIWLMFVAVVPAFLIFLLLFLEVQLTQMLLHKKNFKLRKGSGFHLDQFILGLMTFVCGLFGLPWMCAATVRTIFHVSALSVMSRTHAPGEKPKLLEVKDQRVTNIVMNILIGTCVVWGPLLRTVPMAVLFGVFLYLGVSAISGVQLYKRIKLLFMPMKHHPGKAYIRRVRTIKMHLFTVIQLVLVAALWVVKSTMAAIVFPLGVFLMIPLRLRVLPRVFTPEELAVLDKEEEDSEDEEDEDPDFYQLAHMPV